MTVCTVEEAVDRYERVVTASLSAIGNLSLVIAASNEKEIEKEREREQKNEKESEKESEKEGENKKNSASDNSLGNTTSEEAVEIALQGFKDVFNNKFWSNIAMHDVVSIRRTAYETITAVCTSLPAAICSSTTQTPIRSVNPADRGSEKPESRTNSTFGLSKICAAFCQILSEKSQQNVPSMMLAFLSFTKSFPQCWTHISIDQVLVARLRSLLNESPKCTLEHLLPVFGAIPSDLIAIFASGVTHVSIILYRAMMCFTVL